VLSPVLKRLKEATSALHVEAERYVRILDPDANRSDYVRYLRAMHSYHAPIERMFAASDALQAAGFAADVRCRKAAWMRADLANLGEACAADCTDVPRHQSLSSMIGIAYVLEGSTLGGRFILAKLPPAIAALRGTATRYLEGYGAETGARWRAFAELVERNRVDVASAEAAACETFAKLIQWLAVHESRGTLPLAEAS
jgi:heme oxygenase (biliverdin-IX-beta and delta-forming)